MLQTVEAVEGPLWPFDRNDLGEGGDAGHFYRPLWVLLNAAVLELFGDSATAFHLLNLLLLAVVTVEVWALARRLIGEGAALAAGGFFALYPRHGESVAWVSGNTDLFATALILASLLCLLADWRPGARMASATALAVAAALTKEIGFLVPALAFLVLSAQPRRRWREPAAILAALIPVLLVRAAMIGGTGGYSEDPVTVPRLAASAASYLLGAVTPHELEVLRRPLLLAVPVALVLAGALALHRQRSRRGLALLGLAWFALALLPVLGEPLDLNNATGERLLFLPSVGLALTVGALVPARPVLLAGAGAMLAALCVVSASNWNRAGELAERVALDGVRLAPPGGRLTLLSIPESYRSAHVFTNSFDVAVRRFGGRAARMDWCAPVHVRFTGRGTVAFRRLPGGRFEGTTTWSAPFDFPVTGDPSPLSPGCGYRRRPGEEGSIGLELGAIATPSGRARYAVFDGERLVAVP
jgi:hypothetical protein